MPKKFSCSWKRVTANWLPCLLLLPMVDQAFGEEKSAARSSTEQATFRPTQEGSRDPQSSDTFQSDELAKNLQEQFRVLFTQMSPEAKQGYQHLVESTYLPADFDSEVIQRLALESKVPVPFRGIPNFRSPQANYLVKFGIWPRPELIAKDEPLSAGESADAAQMPLQYVAHGGQFAMNCFACHGGNVFGASFPGAPNNTYMLSALTEEVRMTKIRLGKKLTHMDVGSMAMPLGETIGTSNAVMFGVALMHYRDPELNILPIKTPAPMRHHDMDAPPWWHFHKKSHIYIDGFAEKGHRGLMQFMLIRQNGPEKFREWENDFRSIYAFLQELRPPKYPFPLEETRRSRGEALFNNNCSSCHGTYSSQVVSGTQRHASDSQLDSPTENHSERPSTYPGVRIPLNEIGTDPVRSEALTSEHRQKYAVSWFADYGSQKTVVDLDGYVAPPLDGIWASAPYLHNGSVPTLWHLMHPEERPKVWRRTDMAPDLERVGLHVEELDKVPAGLSMYERRLYFDTTRQGKSAAGHDFFRDLSEEEKLDLLEYLKSL